MNPKKESLTPLKEVLAGLFKDPNLAFCPEDALIFQVWEEVVGSAIAANAKPLWIKNGRLRVKVYASIWLQELGYLEKDIQARLNEKLGRPAIKKIEFRLARE
ncbi:MAG: DUF721 domain-containing protein [Desulfobacteraceae bacterium]|nr:MAG: DUF721 domain-containing protein [Desulfobacteraceae bacterium]